MTRHPPEPDPQLREREIREHYSQYRSVVSDDIAFLLAVIDRLRGAEYWDEEYRR